jgi:glutathione S-transferase
MPEWAGAREWGERRGAQALRGLPYFEDLLAQQPYLAGEAFSMADITLFAALAFADGAGLPIAADLTALAAWRARVAALPAVRDRSGPSFRTEDIERMSSVG